jgi:hypothetical protein
VKRRFSGWRFAILCTVAAIAATACSAGSTDSGGPSAAGPPVRVAVGIDASYAPFFLAASQGLFAAKGVNVEVVQFGTGGEAVNTPRTPAAEIGVWGERRRPLGGLPAAQPHWAHPRQGRVAALLGPLAQQRGHGQRDVRFRPT